MNICYSVMAAISPALTAVIAVLGVILLAILIMLFLLQKQLPNKIEVGDCSISLDFAKLADCRMELKYDRKGRRLIVSTPALFPKEHSVRVIFKLAPVDNRMCKSSKRRICIKGIKTECDKISINKYTYEKDRSTGEIVDPLNRASSSVDRTVGNNALIEIKKSALEISFKLSHS